jgi:hypothetical protein
MIVDATWPMATKGMGTVVNERFVLGQDQNIACEPIKTWIVPEEGNSQEFKDTILKESFTPDEMAHRDEFIRTLGEMTNSRFWKFMVWLDRSIKQGRLFR